MPKNVKSINVPVIISSIFVGLIFLQIFGINIVEILKNLYMMKGLPELHHNASFIAVFTLGVLTSFHCVGMCGGILLSQSTPFQIQEQKKQFSGMIPLLVYNIGRIISYTIIGGIVGGLGKIITPKGYSSSILLFIGGVFLIIMSLNLFGNSSVLRKITIPIPTRIAKKIFDGQKRGPFLVGILSGLLPCGPLQIAQVYALGTQSITIGAFSMFIFSLGTIPLMLTFGVLNYFVNKKFTFVFTKISAVIILLLGFSMIARSFALSGINLPIQTITGNIENENENKIKIQNNLQLVSSDVQPHDYGIITVKKGIPVKWNLHVSQENFNNCNNKVVIPALKIEKALYTGDNFIEFKPVKSGKIQFTCWMGMCRGMIIVED